MQFRFLPRTKIGDEPGRLLLRSFACSVPARLGVVVWCGCGVVWRGGPTATALCYGPRNSVGPQPSLAQVAPLNNIVPDIKVESISVQAAVIDQSEGRVAPDGDKKSETIRCMEAQNT